MSPRKESVMAREGSSVSSASRHGRVHLHGRPLAFALGLVLALALALAPSALASSFTWTGGSTSRFEWSAESNWLGGVAPTSSSTIETLNFPALSSSACTHEPPEAACYESFNDLKGLTVESMNIDDGAYYFILGEPFTLGSGGLSAAPTAKTTETTLSFLLTPIVLAAPQTWKIAGFGGEGNADRNQLYVGEGVTGSSRALSVEISNGGGLDMGGNNEVGPLGIEGANPSQAGVFNGVFGLFGGRLNATDGEAVNVKHVFFYGAGRLGPLRTGGAELYLAVGGGKNPEG
ncbi:MAG TPA: hypothetical protein VGX16_04920, partial [Solirubrobacteraceae bacterium]|nr:hypothetical protein [Solirubrobacteraceae bacterium]